jgi:hypothetical protein
MSRESSKVKRCLVFWIGSIIFAISTSTLATDIPLNTVNKIIVSPPNPTSEDNIVTTIYGTQECLFSEDVHDPHVYLSGNEIYISYDTQPPPRSSLPACALVIRTISVVIPIREMIGRLEAGEYKLIINHWKFGELARTNFIVTNKKDIGGMTTGITTRRILCKNLTTGKRKIIRGDVGTWNCEANGLQVKPGDKIEQRVIGTANEATPY